LKINWWEYPGKTYKDKKGYLRFKDSHILVHRHVMEIVLGRPLKTWEVVHHKNRDKTDNNPKNLWVFSSQEKHDWVHEYDLNLNGVW